LFLLTLIFIAFPVSFRQRKL